MRCKMRYGLEEEKRGIVDFSETGETFFLIGMLNQFMNRFQAAGDHFFEEISWKQCFVIICLGLFKEPPTLKELANMMGCSHQNMKQMLLKLERIGFVEIMADKKDKRKQRIILTEKAAAFSESYARPSEQFMGQLFEGIDAEELSMTINTFIKLDKRLKEIEGVMSTKKRDTY